MKLKKIIAYISAIAMLATSTITASAYTYVQNRYYDLPFTVLADDMQPGEYVIDAARGIKWVYEQGSDAEGKKGRCAIKTDHAATGNNSLYVMGNDVDAGNSLGAKMSIHFGELTGNGTYTIQFDMSHWNDGTKKDYATLNMANWNSSAQLTNGSAWTKSAGFTGSKGGKEYMTYTATMSTTEAPVLNFGAFGWGAMLIDNIVIKDSTGTVVFEENFEGGIPEGWVEPEEPDEPEFDPSVPKHTYLYGKYYELPFKIDEDLAAGEYAIEGSDAKWDYEITTIDNLKGRAQISTAYAATGARSLYLYANHYGKTEYEPGAQITIHLGKITGDGTYTVQFDMAPRDQDYRDFAALNMAGWNEAYSFKNGTTWTKVGQDFAGSAGSLNFSTYTTTLKTAYAPTLTFGVWSGGRMNIDNIIVKDSTGTIVFSEGFEGGIPEGWVEPEEPDEPEFDPSVPKHTYLYGKYYELPFKIDEDLAAGEYAIEGSSAKWEYELTTIDNLKGRAQISTVHAATGDRSLYLYANHGGKTEYEPGAQITINLGKITGDGTYTVQFDMAPRDQNYRDFAALNMSGWNETYSFQKGTTWTKIGQDFTGSKGSLNYSTYTATLKTAYAPTLTFGVWGYGRMNIDNIIVKDSTGTIVFSEGFEGGIPEGWVEPEEPDEPEFDPSVPEHTYLHGKYYELPFTTFDSDLATGDYVIEGSSNGKWEYKNTTIDNKPGRAQITTVHSSSGERSLYLYANHGGKTESEPAAQMTIHLGKLTGDGTYTIQFDAAPWDTDDKDFVALNMQGWNGDARIKEGTTWTKSEGFLGAKGNIGDDGKTPRTYYTYTGTFEITENPQLTFGVFGYGRMAVDNIIVKDSTGTIVFSEGFEGGIPEGWVDPEIGVAVIYDAEFFVVEQNGGEYETIGTATKLKSNTLMMSVVTVKNEISANVYTALYNGNCLVCFDEQTISAVAGGEMSSGSIIEIPSLYDGEYTLKVFVWDENMSPLKEIKLLGE